MEIKSKKLIKLEKAYKTLYKLFGFSGRINDNIYIHNNNNVADKLIEIIVQSIETYQIYSKITTDYGFTFIGDKSSIDISQKQHNAITRVQKHILERDEKIVK